jgi:hypothetical protein
LIAAMSESARIPATLASAKLNGRTVALWE